MNIRFWTLFNSCVFASITATITTPLFAEDNDSLFSLSLTELMNVNVTTTSKYAEKIDDSPGNVLVFSRKQLQQRGYRNVEDLLQALPGVQVQKYSILGIYNSVTIRGASGNNKFLILQDGVRLSTPAGETAAIGNNYPLYYAKRVEVLLGPASVVYGADAFVGVINIITLDNNDKELIEVSLSAGEDGYREGYAQWHKKFNRDSSLNLGLQAFHSQEYRFANDFPELYDDPTKTYDLAPTQDFQFFANYRLNSNWQFGLNHVTHSSSSYFTAKPSFTNYDKGAKEIDHQTTLYTRFTKNINSELQSSTLLTLMNFEIDNKSYFNDNFTGNVPGYKYAQSNRVSINQDFEYKLKLNHLLSGGLVYDYFENIPKSTDLPSPYNTSKDSTNQDLTYNNTTLPIQFFEKQYHNTGIYIQDNWKIDEQWRLVSGLRYDDNSFYGDSLNPRISAIHQYDARNLIKILYGHAFQAPGPDQASTHFGSFTNTQNGSGEWISTATPFRVPNPNIKPETIKTFEINYEHKFTNNTHVKIAPFISQIDDAIVRKNDAVPDQAIPGAQLRNTFKLDNVGKKEIYGIDFSINNKIKSGSWGFENWGYISYLDGSMTNNGKKIELPMVSQYKLTAGSTMTYSRKYLLTPKLYWVNTTNSNQINPNDTSKMLKVPSYFLMDLHGEIKISTAFIMKLDVYNLFDEKFVNAPFANQFFALNSAPQPGRISVISIVYKL
ncbi:MAG: TonB-dependent receptor plug domain-containing protein [Gammaproteobacteria bacterium]